MNFTDFELDKRILKGIKELGFTECTPVQAQSYLHTLQGKDVLAQSQTGSGKTIAFLIPLFHRLLQKKGKALIISPTRELAYQILEECRSVGKFLPFKSECFYGGTGYDKQQKALAKGLDIVIGTPGRLLDFNKSGKLAFDQFSMIIIDEADRLFDMGFYPDIQTIMRKGCKPTERQTMLFSATLNTRVRQLAWEYMNQPVEIEIEPEAITVEEIDQVLFHVSSNEKFRLLLGLLKKENPSQVLIFTNTKTQAFHLSQRLKTNGYKNLFLSGDLTQNKRSEALKKFKEKEIPVMIATDVAARGLHINDLPLVINYDIPEDFEVYVHRIGRTARAGKKGKAITLACEKYVFHLEAIENYINKKIPVEWFEESLLAEELHSNNLTQFPKERQQQSKKENSKNSSNRTRKNRFTEASPKDKKKIMEKPTKESALTDRMAYYAAKYEENFNNQKKSQKEIKSSLSKKNQTAGYKNTQRRLGNRSEDYSNTKKNFATKQGKESTRNKNLSRVQHSFSSKQEPFLRKQKEAASSQQKKTPKESKEKKWGFFSRLFQNKK